MKKKKKITNWQSDGEKLSVIIRRHDDLTKIVVIQCIKKIFNFESWRYVSTQLNLKTGR